MKPVGLIIIALLISHGYCYSSYTSSELFIVEWGHGNSELKASPGYSNVDPGTPEDSTDDYFVTGEGPNGAFVDADCCIIITSSLIQLKGFRDDGDLIFDISSGSPDYQRVMYKGDVGDIFVDSEKRIYLTTVWPMSYVPVINYEDLTVDSLVPFTEDPDVAANFLNWTYDGRIMFGTFKWGWVTYDGEEFIPGGTSAVLSSDGLFRLAYYVAHDKAIFYFFKDPDTSGYSPDADSVIIELGVENLVHVELLNSMEPSHLYLAVYYYTDFSFYEICQFDLEYNLIDKVVPPAEPEYYSSTPKPFITAEGDIYEFRTREDGLHVIRWSKE
ncbi:MAG: hypothetical protein JSU85_04810 [Candidatus Zixiibacteriota bacterium]|nr:MAG: hypothetical protein JSU85_04810 [candidate division Zixibacteria bacterium]